MKIPAIALLFTVLSLSLSMAAPAPAPEAAVNDLFTYLLSSKHDISKDSSAQNRWLSKDVRRALDTAEAASAKAAKTHPDEQVEKPGNGTFLGAWDAPTSFKITGTKAKDTTATVDLLFTWGPKTQYPGETRKVTVQLAQEDGAWRVSDIQAHAAKFNKASTLLGDLHDLAKQH